MQRQKSSDRQLHQQKLRDRQCKCLNKLMKEGLTLSFAERIGILTGKRVLSVKQVKRIRQRIRNLHKKGYTISSEEEMELYAGKPWLPERALERIRNLRNKSWTVRSLAENFDVSDTYIFHRLWGDKSPYKAKTAGVIKTSLGIIKIVRYTYWNGKPLLKFVNASDPDPRIPGLNRIDAQTLVDALGPIIEEM